MDYMDWAFERDLDPLDMDTCYKLYEEYSIMEESFMCFTRSEAIFGLESLVDELSSVDGSFYIRMLCNDAAKMIKKLEHELSIARAQKRDN